MSNLKDIRHTAIKLMNEFQLENWTFKYDKSEKRYGLCSSHHRVISLNPIMVSRNNTERNIEVIKHEIAHAVVGTINQHNEVWKAQMVRMGLSPDVYYSCANTETAPRRYLGRCICGQRLSLTRKRKNATYRCPKCHSPVIMVENLQLKVERAAANISNKYGIDPEQFKKDMEDFDL